MNKKRMSERKSQLRLNIQDFCMTLPENTDPVVGYLLTILQWEASLDVETNSILHKAFVNQIEQIKCKLKMQLKLSKNKLEGSDSHNNNITKFIGEFHKLKQVFAYCLILSKKQSQLYLEVQKFNQYVPRPINLTEELENYLNQPIVFQTIFHNYLRIYNINILTADLISFLFAQAQQKAYLIGFQNEQEPILKWTNPDIELLKSQKIIFKQLTDINKKYVELSEKLKNSYIFYLSNDPLGIEDSNVNLEDDSKGQQQSLLKQKIKRLQQILGKVKKQPRLYSNQKSSIIIMESEPISNLNDLGVINQSKCGKVLQQNKQFFIQTLYGKLQSETFIGDEEFTFMRQKIIKVQTLFFLNRILSAMNAISHVYNQLDLEMRENYDFTFKNLRKMIGSQFISDQIYECKIVKSVYRNAFISNDANNMFYNVVDMQNNKILYPSAVNYFFGFVKSMLSINFQTKQGLLQVLQAKSEYIQILAETLTNIFQLIKTKQLSCYKLLRQYIEIIVKSSPWNNLYGKKFEDIVSAVAKQKYKIGLISQIIYQFDHNYSIKEPLQQLIHIQFQGLTKNCINTSQIYKKILYEIIQIRNGLKIDHYYSINQIHQKFSLLPTDFDTVQDEKGKKQDLYFEDIIHQICTASHQNLYLPKLFFLLDLQLKFKRIIFKLQLCWAYNRQVMFDKKAQAFKEFVDSNCAPIFQIVKKCQSMVDLLQKIEQIQKYIQIFNKEVTRFHLIQKIIAVAQYGNKNISISIREHANRLPLQKLQQLNTLVSVFNPIESQKVQSKAEFIEAFTKNIIACSSYKVDQVKKLDPIFIKQKQKLASIISILNMISMRNTEQDYLTYIFLRFNTKVSYDLYQLKQNKNILCQYQTWLKSDNLDSLIKYNQDLLVLSILRTIQQMETQSQQSQDLQKLLNLMSKFQLSKIFITLRNINQIQFWRSEFGIMTKYHQIYQLMFHFDQFDFKVFQKSQKKLKYKQNKSLSLLDNKFDFNYEASDFISKLFSVYEINPLIRTKLQKNIQNLQNEVSVSQSLYNHPIIYHQRLKKKIYEMFCAEVQKVVNKSELKNEINFNFVASQSPSQHIDNLRKIMLKLVANQYSNQNKQQQYGKFREIQLFKQKKGYQLPIYEVKQNKQYKIGSKKHGDRLKKAVISPHKLQEQQTKPLEQLKRRFKIQMLKKSIQIRKQISKLQLCENKIRDEIVWQTSKLQHSVIQKIKQFITLSNVDQQQSYINFKHTVNLQTIKGIQNVIDEQTSMFMERKNAEVDPQNGFITEVKQKNNEESLNKKGSLLDTNVDSILEHMQKIRIFSAWKKSMKKADLIKKQWCNFNVNVQSILNNRKILQSLVVIQDDRNNYLRQNVTCEIIKQQNMKINQKIQQLKIDNLERKVKNYKQNLLNS